MIRDFVKMDKIKEIEDKVFPLMREVMHQLKEFER